MDTSLKKGESVILLFMYPGTVLKLTQCGPANGFLQRRDGKRRPGAQKVQSTLGGTCLMVPYAIPARKALAEPLKWTDSRKGEVPLDVLTWREIYGSGLIVGTGKRTHTGYCGAVLGTIAGTTPAVRTASGTIRRSGTASSDFVAPGLYSPLFF